MSGVEEQLKEARLKNCSLCCDETNCTEGTSKIGLLHKSSTNKFLAAPRPKPESRRCQGTEKKDKKTPGCGVEKTLSSQQSTSILPETVSDRSAKITRSSLDYLDGEHRCSVRCPVTCQGHLHPNEIVVYEASNFSLNFHSGNPKSSEPRRNPINCETVGKQETVTVSSLPSLSIPARVSLLLRQSPVSRQEAMENTWNPNDCSFNLHIKENDPFTCVRRPVAQSTDCVRGRNGYTHGLHVFTVTWPLDQRGTHAVVGVATKSSPLHSVGYQSLVGSCTNSWGWDLSRFMVYHGREGKPYPVQRSQTWTLPPSFQLILDMDAGTLSFMTEGFFLGPAFTGLKVSGEKMYPIISTVWGNCEVSLTYHGGVDSFPLSLQQLSRETVRDSLEGRDCSFLGLPTKLEKYLNYHD